MIENKNLKKSLYYLRDEKKILCLVTIILHNMTLASLRQKIAAYVEKKSFTGVFAKIKKIFHTQNKQFFNLR